MKKREAIQVISEIVNAGVLNGDFASMANVSLTNSTDPLVQYFTTKLNALQCPMGNTTYPCNHDVLNRGVTNVQNNHSARWVLPNNTKISVNNGGGISSTSIFLVVDTKEQGTRTEGVPDADQVLIMCSLSDSPLMNYAGQVVKGGKCASTGYVDAQWASIWN